jgi:tetratricopeptide (TPR) repeat protein
VQERLAAATTAFDAERFRDAERILRVLADRHPADPAVREMRGLTLYRLRRWRDAVRELEEYRRLTGSVDELPVLADCYRALRRYKKVDELWAELRAASPSSALVTEGRIVAAGALADRGDIDGAIRLLERGPAAPKRPRDHHLRLWYALADLYERAGDTPRARDLFRRVAAADPDLGQVSERLASLG